MRKNRSSCFPVFLLIIVVAAGIWIYFRRSPLPSDEASSVSQEASKEPDYPPGVPVLEWDKNNPDKSFSELSGYLSDLEEVIIIVGSEDLQWQEVCRDNFWVENFTVVSRNDVVYKEYKFKYRDDADKNKEMQKKINKEADDIIVMMDEKKSSFNKYVVLHDELVRRITFDKDGKAPHTHDIYGALVSHKAVCQGYTYAASYIARRAGLGCDEIYSDIHTWNKFTSLPSSEKYTDVTWDDKDICDRNGEPYITHQYFGLTKEEMESLDEHTPEDNSDKSGDNKDIGDNYYRRMGYYVSKGNNEAYRRIFKEQFSGGGNIIEIRFEDDSDLSLAKEQLPEIFSSLDYYDTYYIFGDKEAINTLVIGLYPEKEAGE